MSDCVILFRNTQSNLVGFIHDGDSDEIAVFPDRDKAIKFAMNSPFLKAFPFQIVELTDL